MAKHAKTPWTFDADKIRDVNGETVCVQGVAMPCGYTPPGDVSEANSEFIIRSCNNHDELVAALKLAEQALYFGRGAGEALDFVREAIAKAEGKR